MSVLVAGRDRANSPCNKPRPWGDNPLDLACGNCGWLLREHGPEEPPKRYRVEIQLSPDKVFTARADLTVGHPYTYTTEGVRVTVDFL